jgi:hypothetical protein
MHLSFFNLYFALVCVCKRSESFQSVLQLLGSIQILKFQENLKYFDTMYENYDISSLSTGWTTSNQYGFSIWSKTAVLSNGFQGWQDYFRVSNEVK